MENITERGGQHLESCGVVLCCVGPQSIAYQHLDMQWFTGR